MVYLEKTGQDVTTFIPKVYGADFDDRKFTLEAFSTVNRNRVEFDNLIVDYEDFAEYFHVTTVVPEDAEFGEYNYVFKDKSGRVLSSGVMMIGTKVVPRKKAKIERTYKQYGNNEN